MSPRLFTATVLALAVLVPTTSAAAASPTGYNPQGLPTVGCFWTGPFTASNELTNIAFPGTDIAYWGAKFVTPPGAKLTLTGRFPHSRYASFNAYTDDGSSTSSLSDRRIRPDRGSINPARPGKNRKAKNRSYTVSVKGRPRPANPARNTLFAEPTSGAYQDILYRVYVPDRGRNLAGGTGVPRPKLTLADGTVLTGQALCNRLNSIHDYNGNFLRRAIYDAKVNTPGKNPATNPAVRPIAFRKFFNLPVTLAAYGSESDLSAAWQANPDEVGVQYNNNDARYMTGAYSFNYGRNLILRGRMPTTPKTHGGEKRAASGQLVEWDMCSIESLVTTRTYRCLFDEGVPLIHPKKRHYLINVSLPKNRPWNARRRCGVAWLAADPAGDGAGRPNTGALLIRNVLPSPGFKRSIWSVTSPFNAARVMGPYYPSGHYTGKKEFASHGCPYRH